jgi:hypothetical protein
LSSLKAGPTLAVTLVSVTIARTIPLAFTLAPVTVTVTVTVARTIPLAFATILIALAAEFIDAAREVFETLAELSEKLSHLTEMSDGHRSVVASLAMLTAFAAFAAFSSFVAFAPRPTPSWFALTATSLPLLQMLPDQLGNLTHPGLIE